MSNTGIAAIFALAEQYHATTGEVNNLSAKFVSMLLFMTLAYCLRSVAGVFSSLVSWQPMCLILVISLTRGRDRMGWSPCGDARSSLWPLAGALLVTGACQVVGCECLTFTYHLYRSSASGS